MLTVLFGLVAGSLLVLLIATLVKTITMQRKSLRATSRAVREIRKLAFQNAHEPFARIVLDELDKFHDELYQIMDKG